jgi:tetratricopeptide (TPR) repeat protein
MNPSTDWASALAILAAGLVLGLLVYFASRRRKASAGNRRAELEARRDELVQQLRDLGDDATDEERVWLERETAEVLRDIDGLPSAPKTDAQPAPQTANRRPALLGFVGGVVVTLVAGAIVYYGSTFTNDRNAPAQAMAQSGSTDIEQRIAAAKDAFARNDLMGTFDNTKAVLDVNPNEPRALTYNAIVRMAMGEVDSAKKMLEQATKTDPKLLDAWVALSSARIQSGDMPGATAAINTAIATSPQDEARLRSVFEQFQKQAAEGPVAQASAPAGDLPPDHPPIPGAGDHAAPADSSKPIRITLALAPGAKMSGGIVYLIARGGQGGHPVAVKRIETNAFPMSIDFGVADSMMGATLPGKMRVEARLDTDGDAGTTDPADPRAVADGVVAGSTVTMTLASAK